MNKFKEMLIRKGFKFKVKEIEEGQVEVIFETAVKLKDEYSEYFYLLDEVPGVIKGIEKVTIDIKVKKAKINFNNRILEINDIEKILDDIKEFIIEQWDFISGTNEDELEKAIIVLKNNFKDRIAKN
ncbi:hypothetical protein [uncultured Clostridium sp.]|uniref:hypothetical protein n=1 Tax=uncultured Clostridium sp. TaxID=59620 RepID=UPI0026184CC5|nr:hypothetical protein [uncultured Clostridium sp.]